MTPIVAMTEKDLRDLASDAAEKAIAKLAETHVITPRDPWSTIPEAAERLGVSEATIRRRIVDGTLQAEGSGRLRRVKV